MNVQSALLRNLAAGAWSRAAAILLRLAQVPLLLASLGPSEYGRWLLLSSVPVWLTIGNLGVGSAAANRIAMASAARRRHVALSIYATGILLISGIVLVVLLLSLVVVPRLDWVGFLSAGAERREEFVMAMLWLITSVLVSFYNELFGGRYMAGRKAYLAIFLQFARPLFEFLLLIAALHVSSRLDVLGGMVFLSALFYMLCNGLLSARACRWLRFRLRLARWHRVRGIWTNGVAFQAFPIGHALVLQGTLYVVNGALGPSAVAAFGSARTFVRSVNQVAETVNQTVSSELTYLIGAGNLPAAARVHRLSVGLSGAVSLSALVVLALVGYPLFEAWTGRALAVSPTLLLLFLLPIPLQSLWFPSSVVLMASNEHRGLAARFVIAAAIACASCAVLADRFGLAGAALSTAAMDMVLIPYVLRNSLRVTQDTWGEFRRGVPQELNRGWRSALARLGLLAR